ncbi:MAG: hypothetical protein B6D62_01045 [Candidatus Cloacimonas sp. 4484_275]|nr:MAG: hypothetical protein B6D62_01045 [Candidatus Cloacimonas sp. 4484_275]
MRIIEIERGIYINIDNVFKIELVRIEKSEKCYWKFYSADENNYAISKEFDDVSEAREWLSMQSMRAIFD